MKQIKPFYVQHGHLVEVPRGSIFLGVKYIEPQSDNSFVEIYALIDDTKPDKRRYMIHLHHMEDHADLKGDWFVGYSYPLFVFAEPVK